MKKPKLFTSSKPSGANKFKVKKMYDSPEWVEFRNKFLAVNQKCYACGERSRAVDHLFPHKRNEKLMWESTNFIPLCHQCHNTITANFDRYNPPKFKEKLIWIKNKRDYTGTNISVRVLNTDKYSGVSEEMERILNEDIEKGFG